METKRCASCGYEKPVDYFYKDKRASDGLYSSCMACTRSTKAKHRAKPGVAEAGREYTREYMRDHTVEANERRKAYKRRKAQWVADYLSAHPCVDCGESDIVVLDFDHINDDKLGNIGRMIGDASLLRIMREVEKCEVVCSNCHRRRTAKRAGQFRWLLGNPQPVDAL